MCACVGTFRTGRLSDRPARSFVFRNSVATRMQNQISKRPRSRFMERLGTERAFTCAHIRSPSTDDSHVRIFVERVFWRCGRTETISHRFRIDFHVPVLRFYELNICSISLRPPVPEIRCTCCARRTDGHRLLFHRLPTDRLA